MWPGIPGVLQRKVLNAFNKEKQNAARPKKSLHTVNQPGVTGAHGRCILKSMNLEGWVDYPPGN
jgi:hypothetical protein